MKAVIISSIKMSRKQEGTVGSKFATGGADRVVNVKYSLSEEDERIWLIFALPPLMCQQGPNLVTDKFCAGSTGNSVIPACCRYWTEMGDMTQ